MKFGFSIENDEVANGMFKLNNDLKISIEKDKSNNSISTMLDYKIKF